MSNVTVPTGASITAPSLIDSSEPKLRITEAAAECGIRIHHQTGLRWALHGIASADGRRIKLATVKLGHARLTTIGAVREFLRALQERDVAPQPVPTLSVDAADQVLAAHGLPRKSTVVKKGVR